MHCQLRAADIGAVYGDMGGRNIAQGGAARNVGMIEIRLHRDIGIPADTAENGSGNSVCGVFLICIVF